MHNQHCCDMMQFILNENRIAISYLPIYREYRLKLKKEPVYQTLWYCPWCGTKLLPSVRKTYFKILREEYDIDDDTDPEQMKRLPPEFETDEWWKKRGL